MSTTKTLVLLAAGIVLFGLVVCGGGAAYWYFKIYRGTPPDVGPLAGQALILPTDTAVVGGWNVKALLASAVYKQVAAGEVLTPGQALPAEEAQRIKTQIREGIEKGLKEVEDKIGIRLDRDVDRVIVAGSNVGAPTPEVVAFVFGRFDRPKITQAIEASAKTEKATVTAKVVEGVPVLVFAEPGKPGAELAFLDETTLMVGTVAGIESVLGNHAKRVRPLEGNASFISLVKGIDPTSGYWLAIDQSVAGRIEKEAGGTPPVPLPRTLTLAGAFDGGITLTGQMADEAAAKGLVDSIDQGLTMIRQQAAQNPEARKVPGAKEVLDRITAKAEGKTVRLNIPGGSGGASLGGLVTAVAIPSLLRARVSANEAATIGDIRTVISAQAAYDSTSGGGYGDLACLAEPKSCIDEYSGPSFLDPTFASASEKSGYKRSFQPGPAASAVRRYQSFAYTAVPTTPGQTGVRSFCGDASGLVCFDPSGTEIVPQAGACPRTCLPLDGSAPPSMMSLPPTPAFPSAPEAPPATPSRPRPPVPQRTPAPRRTPPVAAPAPAPEAPAPTQPLRIGGSIKEPRKLKNVSPEYPSIAKQARVQGVVILECNIGAQGKVTEVKVLRSIPLLDNAALTAVRQWEYEPTLLNGTPVPVVMTVTVNFKLN